MICDPYVGEEQVAVFEIIFNAVRHIWSYAYLRKEYFWYISSTTESYPTFSGKSPSLLY